MPNRVRVCLNDNGFTRPSGSYKAHSRNVAHANSHSTGIGMEEWLNSDGNVVQGSILKNLGFQGIEDSTVDYRIAFIEAYSSSNYQHASRQNLRDVDLVINMTPNVWRSVAHIKNIRGLSNLETNAIFSYFWRTGTISQMNIDMRAARAVAPSIAFPNPPPIILRSTPPTDVFSCIFKANDITLLNSRTNLPSPWPTRYRWRY